MIVSGWVRSTSAAQIRRPRARRVQTAAVPLMFRRGGVSRSNCAREALLLPDDFVVAPPCAFAHHPARRRLERPAIAGERTIVAPDGRRHAARAAVACNQHALLGLERAPGS